VNEIVGNDSLRLLVDSRESRSAVPGHLRRFGHAFDMVELSAGDYAVPGKFVLERKASNDFVASIEDGRLFGQAELLAGHHDQPFIVLEGSIESLHSAMNPESIAGALSALAVFYQIQILPSPSPEFSARQIGRLQRHYCAGLGYDIPSRVLKPRTDGGRSQYLVEGLPGVGAAACRSLLTHFGSAAAVFAADEASLSAVKGIGAKTAKGIRQALEYRPTGYRSTKGPPT
jgi:ERCC4-type nuclease